VLTREEYVIRFGFLMPFFVKFFPGIGNTWKKFGKKWRKNPLRMACSSRVNAL